MVVGVAPVLKRLSYISLFIFLWAPLIPTKAEPSYDFDALSHALQAEYQGQLKQNSHTAQKTKPATPAPRVIRHQIKQKPASKVTHRLRQTSKTPPKYQPQITNKKPDPKVLFNAASSGNNQIIARLLSQGININIANNEGETALHMAAAHGHYSTVIYLINHKAYLNARTIKNWLPLHHATRFRHANIANYLKQQGSSPYARTSDGLSAIDMAKSLNDKRLIHILTAR